MSDKTLTSDEIKSLAERIASRTRREFERLMQDDPQEPFPGYDCIGAEFACLNEYDGGAGCDEDSSKGSHSCANIYEH